MTVGGNLFSRILFCIEMKSFIKRFFARAGLLIVLRADLFGWVPSADRKHLSVPRTDQGAGKQCHISQGFLNLGLASLSCKTRTSVDCCLLVYNGNDKMGLPDVFFTEEKGGFEVGFLEVEVPS